MLAARTRRGWPLDRVAPLERSILRLALWEIQSGVTPPEVAIDEAVRLAKRYSTDEAGAFVNGVLGGVVRARRRTAERRADGEAAWRTTRRTRGRRRRRRSPRAGAGAARASILGQLEELEPRLAASSSAEVEMTLLEHATEQVEEAGRLLEQLGRVAG